MIRVDNALSIHAKQGCYVCNNPNNLVDTEVSIPYEGVLAICVGCAKDLAQTAGWDLEVQADEVVALRQSVTELTTERDSLDKELSAIGEATKLAIKRHRERQRRAQA